MKAEQVFGVSAGKVWTVLNVNKKAGPISVESIMKSGNLTRDAVMAGLGWLGREGKIEVFDDKGNHTYKLL